MGFDATRLYTDPDNKLYEALDFKKDLGTLAFNEATPYSILERFQKGESKDLTNALQRWKPWIPPKLDQGLQQGGCLVWQGQETIYRRKDPATGAHAPLDQVLKVAIDNIEY